MHNFNPTKLFLVSRVTCAFIVVVVLCGTGYSQLPEVKSGYFCHCHDSVGGWCGGTPRTMRFVLLSSPLTSSHRVDGHFSQHKTVCFLGVLAF